MDNFFIFATFALYFFPCRLPCEMAGLITIFELPPYKINFLVKIITLYVGKVGKFTYEIINSESSPPPKHCTILHEMPVNSPNTSLKNF